MSDRSDPRQLYTQRGRSYIRFVNLVGYAPALRAYFLKSPLLRSGLHVLDAGCGTGIVTLALRQALLRRGFNPGVLRGFDLTPKMLEDFQHTLRTQAIEGVNVVQADVLQLATVPADWNRFDLIVSASMMEYIPREKLVDALSGLRSRLHEAGRIVLFITRRNWLTKPLIGRWWDANLSEAAELEQAFGFAGFSNITFGKFPFPYSYLSVWGHIIEAKA